MSPTPRASLSVLGSIFQLNPKESAYNYYIVCLKNFRVLCVSPLTENYGIY